MTEDLLWSCRKPGKDAIIFLNQYSLPTLPVRSSGEPAMIKEVESLAQKAQQAVASGQNEEAKAYYLKALDLRSDLPNLQYGLATVYYLLGDLPTAAKYFKEVTRLDPVRAGAFINLGAVYNKLDRLDDAIN